MKKSRFLLASSLASTLILTASPVWAQEAAPAAPQAAETSDGEGGDAGDEIVVTGSIIRRTDLETPSPITVVSAEDLDKRGISTAQEAIQQLTSNNGPALTNSFTANGAFGAGASAVSLRGLSTSSTLVLFDGLRAASYPLADDGARNFVDLNTIPDDIIDRIEVLRDGASSSYGADAVAGVVNIITKRSFTGIGGRVEAGSSGRGDAGNQRLSLTAGIGDLDDKGFNAYISGFYVHSAQLRNRQRPYPYNSDDQRNICFNGTCGPNNIVNGLNAAGAFPNLGFGTGASTLFVRPFNAANTAAQGRNQLLNPTLGCNRGTTYNPTAAELAASNNGSVPTTVCQEDVTKEFGVIAPEIERFGGSVRVTARIGDKSEAYFAANFQQSTVNYDGSAATIRGNAPAGILFPRFTNSSGPGILTLPVFVCARQPDGTLTVPCTAANGPLNPNNPFAAQGQVARLVGRLPNITEFNETRSRVYRAAAGISGTVLDNVTYQVDVTAVHNDLRRTSAGYVYIQNLINVVADGTYNFVNPFLNTKAQNDYLAPKNVTDSTSDLYQAQLIVGKPLFELPGGLVQLGLGASIRYEAIDAPSANDDFNGPTQRYFRLNAFGSKGHRTVKSAFAEIGAPVFDKLELNLSGRYDSYSSGQSSFSPKAGFKFTPIKQLAFRGTYSRGFRIPSFAEANALPTTGFVTQSRANLPNNFLNQYGATCNNGAGGVCPAYITGYSIGLTSLGTPNLGSEKSRSITGGVIFEPIHNVTLTFDYYNIRKTNAITSADTTPAVAAYYAGRPIPAGFTVVADAPDPNFPNALPRIAFVQSGFINANTIKSEGIDFSATGKFDLGSGITFTTSGEASYIIELSTSFPDGHTEQYAGTLGNFNLTSGSGTPRWRGSLQGTLEYGDFSLTGSGNYFGGYNLSAEDQGGVAGDCGLSTGITPCRVSSYFTLDLTGNLKVNDKFEFYVNMLNVFNRLPPIDPVTYGANNYNAVQGGTGINGRAFRAGAKFKF